MKKKTFQSYPYILWSLVFTIVPILIVAYYAFTEETDTGVVFTLENIKKVITPDNNFQYLRVYGKSVLLAVECTAICLLIGYPAAYAISKCSARGRNILMMLLMIPMWINFLLRTYAWMTLLEDNGVINSLLSAINLPKVELMYNDTAVLLGMVYNFLPFMVLPIYTSLLKVDNRLIEAAHDLGAGKVRVFGKVVLPLTVPGIVSGITMTLLPALTTFVVSRLLGGGDFMLIGNLIEQQYLTSANWNFGSSLSFVLMVFILITMFFVNNDTKEGESGVIM